VVSLTRYAGLPEVCVPGWRTTTNLETYDDQRGDQEKILTSLCESSELGKVKNAFVDARSRCLD
jgi:hypothetical protein